MELVRYLISTGANVNATTATGDTALTYACENGHTDVADLLLQAYAKLEHESEGGRTPLMKAARAGHLCTVQFLISKGSNVNKQTTNNDHTPLSLACAGGHITVVELLLAHGADPTHKLKDNSTMLIEASRGGHTPVVQLLLDYPNSMLASPPPPPDLSQAVNAGLESSEAPRVPPHGLQAFHSSNLDSGKNSEKTCYSSNAQSASHFQEILPPLQSTPKQGNAKHVPRRNTFVKNNEAPSSSFCDHQQRFIYRNLGQANSLAVQTETSKCLEHELCGGGGLIESLDEAELKPSERLEQCINSMMKKAEMLHPSPEEQILQKQQILEELQRVERELQEKAHAQILLTQHHQNVQALGTIIANTPVISAIPSSTTNTFSNVSGGHTTQQLLINSNTLLDVDSISSLNDISNNLALTLPPIPGVSPAQYLIYQNRLKSLQEQHRQGTVSASTLAAEYCKVRSTMKQQGKQAKLSAAKQVPPQMQFQAQGSQTQNEVKADSPNHLDSFDKMNIRNIVLNEQQQQQFQLQQHLLQQHSQQQQYVLSQTFRGADYCEGAIAGIMHAMGKINVSTDGTRNPAMPMYDPVTVGHALLQQQQHLVLNQQVTQVVQQDGKSHHPQGQPNVHCEKNIKVVKGKSSKGQQYPHFQANLATLQAQQLLKQQLLARCGDNCSSLVDNIPLDGAGFAGMAAPAFPVSIAVTSPVSIATSCGATFTMASEEGLMVAAPARTLNEALGEIGTAPITQLSGSHVQQNTHCPETCPHHSSKCSRSQSMSAIPSGSCTSSAPLPAHLTRSCLEASVSTDCINHQVPPPSTPPLYPPLDLNTQTDSNHDTALTLACAGGHEELVTLLLARGADIEHRDKKGFSPLMIAGTAGHAGVVEILLNHSVDIEAPAERTKDTALSMACSGGRYEVVDILLARGANKEHRNVSDYTPLSLAASGGYVNIIKLLLGHGAEINSRTGSKLGISPLMLAAMNGHVQAVKLLLDMGSDINAQIETNRNTALTLACFQGRNEVVGLLLDRKANVEHRAKTGLTPLMEAASGGYVEVGKVLIDKGADVNAPPVPSSRDTALTIAADKGHYRFVQLLLERDAIVEVKNKKGNSPLWLAAHGGHLEVVQLLCTHNADIDSQDNRKVSCLMAAFRKGHVKVVKWMVKHVSQFPSDQEMARFMSTLTDKEMLKKCSQCVDTIRIAKERQAAEANKNANILLEELDLERCREESRKAAAARRRERKRKKKQEKQEQMRAAKAAEELVKKYDKKDKGQPSDQSDVEDEEEEDDDDEDEDEEEDKEEVDESISRLSLDNSSPSKAKPSPSSTSTSSEVKPAGTNSPLDDTSQQKSPNLDCNSRSQKGREKSSRTQDKNKRNVAVKASSESSSSSELNVVEKHVLNVSQPVTVITSSNCNNRNGKKRNQKPDANVICPPVTSPVVNVKPVVSAVTTASVSPPPPTPVLDSKSQSPNYKHYKSKDLLVNGITPNTVPDYDEICALFTQSTNLRLKNRSSSDKMGLDDLDLPAEVALSAGLRSPSIPNLTHGIKSCLNNSSPKKWQKRDEGWKEVVRSKLFNRSKKVCVPANAISRVIGRGGMNINAIREASGAHIEVEKQKGQGDRTVIIRGSGEATRIAQQLIMALIKEPEKELSEILSRCGLSRIPNSTGFVDSYRPSSISINTPLPVTAQLNTTSSQNKNLIRQQVVAKTSGNVTISVTKTTSIPPPSLPANATPPFTNQIRSVVSNTQNIRPGIPVNSSSTPPFLSNGQNAWTGVVVGSGKMPTSLPRPSMPICTSSPPLNSTTVSARVVVTTAVEKISSSHNLFLQEKKNSQPGSATTTKTTVSYTMAVIAQGKAPKTVNSNMVSVATKVTATTDIKVSTIAPIAMERAGSAPPTSAVQMTLGHNSCSGPSPVQPFSSNHSPKLSNGSSNVQQGTTAMQARVHVTQAPASKPFVTPVASASQAVVTTTPPTLSSEPLLVTSEDSSLAQEYSPFSNIFSKVAQSVWGQKDKEASKPNFASVAASGVTSVASQIQNSNPVQSTLTLSLPQNAEADLIVDAAKAPGYRGNLHISPSACSNSPASSNSNTQVGMAHNANFGPIGSGPRSAPCTPPLGPRPPSSASNSIRHSTPPAPQSPPRTGHSRSLPESQSPTLDEMPRSMAPQQAPPHQMSEGMFQQQQQNMSSQQHPSRLQSYPMASTLASPGGGTNTTFSQNTPLSSVGNILPEGANNNGPMQVVQSNLNPNAPDFSSRASLLMAHMHQLQRMPNSFQENSVPPHLAAQFLASGGGMNPGFPLHALPLNRFPFHHAANHHQQQQTEYNQNAGMSQEADNMPLLSMVSGYHHPPGSGNIPHYPPMQSMMGIRPNQRSSSTTPSVGTSSKDEGSPMAPMSPSASPQGSNLSSPTPGMNVQDANPNPAGTIGEDRKLPRPIGMERAQRKNPMFGAEIPADWIQNMNIQNSLPHMQPDDGSIPPSMQNYTGNRFPDMMPLEPNHPVDQSFQTVPGGGGFPFVNGLPPHMIASHLYQNNANIGTVDGQIEMWGLHQKVPLSSGGGDGLPQNVEHKMTWQNWSPHQA
ncbi:hypothetical protein JTE90_008987 [Oedothorax gibbosus]|uniref:K Homology domain-containing protein n=1 Tax=Oedothorax gibbosus TaxID=931172 RepID=A0AAV6UJ87_9ARAC|nr:hypothetical protein JTE90_008987 [Oedothorax gibbosus]